MEELSDDPRKVDLYASRHDGPKLAGSGSLYRIGFQSMQPNYAAPASLGPFFVQLTIGRVRVSQTEGPVRTQTTSVVQQPGLTLVWRKRVDMKLVVGDGLPLSVFEIEDTFGEQPHEDLRGWRQEALAAAGVLATLFDGRFVQREVFEDALVLSEGGSVRAGLDYNLGVRTFFPAAFFEQDAQAARSLESVDLSEDRTAATAAKWFLRGIQAGPTADAVVFLWIALEALVSDVRGKTVARRVENALLDSGEEVPPELNIGKLYGVRSKIVHAGEELPWTQNAFHQLEAIARHLLRARLGVKPTWPPSPSVIPFPEPLKSQIAAAWKNPQTIMH
ncbi:MAG: HEPN domain-containing protein [Actinomycetota bacterium]|nr:HEPN domain-containing protein [Actinomycetota bacterium]